MTSRKREAIASLFFLFLIPGTTLPAITLKTSGKWTLRLRKAELTEKKGGCDFNPMQESGVDQVTLNIKKTTGGTASWRIDIRRVDNGWDSDLRIFAQRTSDGTGTGSIAGGSSYIEVTTIDRPFFTGSGDRLTVGIQYKVEGVSVFNLNVASYITAIWYTVTEL